MLFHMQNNKYKYTISGSNKYNEKKSSKSSQSGHVRDKHM